MNLAGNTDPRVDAYIASSADFAKPILTHLRQLVHDNCPGVTETIKWRMPAFEYKGLLCGMAAFKQHAIFNFWKYELVLEGQSEAAMGQFGRLGSFKDLPPDDVLAGYIRKAAQLNAEGVKAPRRTRTAEGSKSVALPPFFAAALRKNKKALANFEAFSHSHKREYVEWLASAKREETRQKRLKTAIEWITQGKPQNWKYMNC